MWEWREDTRPGGWRFDAASAWTWQAVPPHKWADEPTPIFRAVALDWERRRREELTGHGGIVDGDVAALPEPRPGLEPLPVQRSEDTGRRRRLALVDASTSRQPSTPPQPRRAPEDEPPLVATPPTGGRHARRPRAETTDRHAPGFVTLTPRR
jgi:hypothetical protein